MEGAHFTGLAFNRIANPTQNQPWVTGATAAGGSYEKKKTRSAKPTPTKNMNTGTPTIAPYLR